MGSGATNKYGLPILNNSSNKKQEQDEEEDPFEAYMNSIEQQVK